ncbi:MAG: hypothetical protein WDZ53_01250 [Balneolales bacterium]
MWTFLTIIIVVSILAGTFSEYHKRNKTSRIESEKERAGFRKEMDKLKKRLENLEAIAAADPEEFSGLNKAGQAGHADKENDPDEEINELLKKRRSKS